MTTFAKTFIKDVWYGPTYACGIPPKSSSIKVFAKKFNTPNLSTLSLALGAGICFFDFTLVPALFMEWLIVHNLILIKSFLIVPTTSYQS